MKKLHRLVVALAVVLGIAMPAAAHNKIAPVTPAIDLRDEIVAQERGQTLPVFAGANAFDEVAHVELPPPSIADELARRFAATDVEPPSELPIFSPTVSQKLALGPLAAFEENNISEVSELGRELHQGLGYVRERWLDPQTGTFLSPDPKGYVDSANLYAFAGGDPVNRRDPTGEDAYDDKLQGYIRWYSDQHGAMDQEYKRLQGAYKRAVATNNDVGLIVADINIIERNRLMFGGSVEGAATFIEYARSKGDASVLRMSNEDIYAEVVGDEAVRGVGAAVVGAFMPRAPAVRRSLRRGSSRVASAYNNSVVSSETGAVGPQVTNKSKAARLRDARGRFSTDPENPPSPYVYTDAQRRAAWKKLAEDPTSPLTPMQRQQIRERGWRGPQQVNPRTGELETMELSHEPTPLRDGGTEVVPRWPDEHAAVDPHRHLKKRQ
jgi:RHS repeat-associated protein